MISRRFAVDWVIDKPPADPRDRASYFAYGQDLYAVADGRVLTAEDGHAENTPGHGRDYRPAEPISMANIGGNRVVIDLGGGQYAHYLHMQPGSLAVKVGDHVRRGQRIGRIGASGDAREPHLHFELTTSPRIMAGEGLPYVIDAYKVMDAAGSSPRRRELPLNNQVIDFGEAHTASR